jgi:PKD repeat protein
VDGKKMRKIAILIIVFMMFSLTLITTIPIMSPRGTDISNRPTGPSSGYVGEALFFISDISLCDISREVLYYEWDWGCCQSGELTDGRTSFKVWGNPGTYDVKVRAVTGIIRRDEYGKPVSIRDKQTTNWSPALTVTILEVNNPPNTPSTPSGPSSGTVGTSYTFSTSATDSDGDKIKYLFDWGDGTESSWTGLVSSGSQGSSSNTWYSPGTYFIKTQVKDEHGTTSGWSTTIYITISDGDIEEDTNKQPDASFTFSPSNPTTDDIIQFNDKSTDYDGTIASWSWNFGDVTSSTTKNPQHKFSTTGTYTVVLEVTDNDGAKKSLSKTITVRQPEPPNNQPTANFSFTPSTATTNDTIQFTDNSIDTDGTITAYLWNFGGGTSSTNKNPEHRYTTNGIYTITLKITDNDGATDLTSKAILVENPHSNDLTANSNNKGTPGFELIIIIGAIALVMFWRRKRRERD